MADPDKHLGFTSEDQVKIFPFNISYQNVTKSSHTFIYP